MITLRVLRRKLSPRQIKAALGQGFAVDLEIHGVVAGMVEAGGEVLDGLLPAEGEGFTGGEGELLPFEDFGRGAAVLFHVVEGIVHDETLWGGGLGFDAEVQAELLA